jgi:hypothetical protein
MREQPTPERLAQIRTNLRRAAELHEADTPPGCSATMPVFTSNLFNILDELARLEAAQRQTRAAAVWAAAYAYAFVKARIHRECSARGVDGVEDRLADAAVDKLAAGTAPTEPETWLIWSCAAEVWWKPNRSGYTVDVAEAGRYSLAEAEAICSLRSPREDGKPNEIIVPSPELVEARR